MKEFTELTEIIDRLLGPDGCPWDREQTLRTVRSHLLEETCEVLEAIDLDDNRKIEEELGDLCFNVLFMCRLAEKENRFTTADTLRHIIAKLIRRHPHVFGSVQVDTSEQVLKQWEAIKKTEYTHTSAIDNIPKDLPSLARAQKILKKVKKTSFSAFSQEVESNPNASESEEELGRKLFTLVAEAGETGVDAEQALRTFLANFERRFRAWEEIGS